MHSYTTHTLTPEGELLTHEDYILRVNATYTAAKQAQAEAERPTNNRPFALFSFLRLAR